MKNLFATLSETLQHTDAVLATVVASSGSTPRGSGARMIVTKEGRICGTIGGGAVEYRCEKIAAEVLASHGTRYESFRLTADDVAKLGMICGGDVDVLFQYYPTGDDDALALCSAIAARFASNEQTWLITELESPHAGRISIYSPASGLIGNSTLSQPVLQELITHSGKCTVESKQYSVEELIRSERVLIFGGGHVAQALVPVLSGVGFRCSVFDDRPEFTAPALFPQAERTELVDFQALDRTITVSASDYAVVMTRGHQYDTIVQAQMLRTPACYIGVIGSRRKKAGVEAQLIQMGFTRADLDRITTPIGLDIGAETPAEIAISITAQLIAHRAAAKK